jgi:GNAT superfamily N-acetyltransferase
VTDEPRHNLLLGLLSTIRAEPGHYPERTFWTVEDGGRTVGFALRTPPHNLVLARPLVEAATGLLATAIADDLPGVTAARPEADAFARAWAERTGARLRIQFEQRVYALTTLRPPPAVAGSARPAAGADRALVLEWFRAFWAEALHEPQPDADVLGRDVDLRLAGGTRGLLLWEDGGEVVSLAGWGGETPNGMRVGPVYTPPERRRRGYASAVVAELSARLLAGGRRCCFLYTDLANPTANRIYADLGYEPVCDSVQYAFVR